MGVSTFFAASHPNDKCGANGLPLTPNSIKIYGRLQKLKAVDHPLLAKYVDVQRGQHERLLVVSEFLPINLGTEMKKEPNPFQDPAVWLKLSHDLFQALHRLNQDGIVHHLLSPKQLMLTEDLSLLLAGYGLFSATGGGRDVDFPIGHPKYLPPEVVVSGPRGGAVGSDDIDMGGSFEVNNIRVDGFTASPKVDVFSAGLLLLEAFLGFEVWSYLNLQQIFFKIMSFVNHAQHPLDVILRDHSAESRFNTLPESHRDLIRLCLTVSPSSRPSPAELLQLPLFSSLSLVKTLVYDEMFSTRLRCADLELPPYDSAAMMARLEDLDYLSERSIEEVYYLWTLAGGDLEAVLRKAGKIKAKPPVMSCPAFIAGDGSRDVSQGRDSGVLFADADVVPLPMEQLREKIDQVEPVVFYPLLLDQSGNRNIVNNDQNKSKGILPLHGSTNQFDFSSTVRLPLVIRERDVVYQLHRLVLFRRLLLGHPYTRPQIWKEVKTDVTPLYRGKIWAALLDVEGDVRGGYERIDKDTRTSTDRQIEVDIPRCHQYSALLSSPAAHRKFKRILKAWIVSNPHLVYWQGLDSLCAPFLALNFNDEAVAFASLSAFIPKYLHNFFLKDNSPVIQEYLAKFSQLISFHDPQLSSHMTEIGFIPELYSIPWFLTMFTHVFPLHKIFQLWDTMLLGNSSFPLFVGVAILKQLREQLLSFGFNECILLFSDMPEIDIAQCVLDSIKMFCSTPKSCSYRQHAGEKNNRKSSRAQMVGRSSSSSRLRSLTTLSTAPTEPRISSDEKDKVHADSDLDGTNDPDAFLRISPPLDAATLKCETCPRISAEDVIDIGGFRQQLSRPEDRPLNHRPKILVVDIRSEEEFFRGCVESSVNIPFESAFAPDGTFEPSPNVITLEHHKGKSVVAIVGGELLAASLSFASRLVTLGYPRVCVVHGGIQIMKTAGLVSVPDI